MFPFFTRKLITPIFPDWVERGYFRCEIQVLILYPKLQTAQGIPDKISSSYMRHIRHQGIPLKNISMVCKLLQTFHLCYLNKLVMFHHAPCFTVRHTNLKNFHIFNKLKSKAMNLKMCKCSPQARAEYNPPQRRNTFLATRKAKQTTILRIF